MTAKEEIDRKLNKYILKVVDNEWTFSSGIWEAIYDTVQQARIDELEKLDTFRHYGKDYQDSMDELDEYKEKRLTELRGEQ